MGFIETELLKNLRGDWVEVHRLSLESDEKRPTIPIPNLIMLEMKQKDFKTHYGNIPGPFGVLDSETWRDFHKPNLFSFLFFWSHQANKRFERVGMKPQAIDGIIERDEKGWPIHWEKNEDSWKKDKDGNPIKPKSYGTRKTTGKQSDNVIRLAIGWLWHDQLELHWPGLVIQTGVKRIYAHNLTVDLIAWMSRFFPNLHHPLEHFVCPKPDDRGRLLLKGSSVLTSTIDLGPFLGEDFERTKWNHKDKRWEKLKDYPLEFCDSYSILPLPLKALAKIEGYDMRDTPEKFWNSHHPDFGNPLSITPDDVGYALMDSVCVWTSIIGFWTLCKSELGYHGKRMFPLTIGTLGFQMVAHSLAQAHKNGDSVKLVSKVPRSWKYQTIVNEELDSILRDCMTGGMTRTVNTHYQPYEGEVHGFDANSMYPASQLMKEVAGIKIRFPNYTQLTAIDFDNVRPIEEWLDEVEGGVYVKWVRPDTDPLGIIATRQADGLLSWEEMEGERWLTLFQYRFAKSRGYELQILDPGDGKPSVIVCPGIEKTPFDVIQKWYELRLKLKKDDDMRENYIKLLLNAGGFGKWLESNTDYRVSTLQLWIDNYPDDWDFKKVVGAEGVTYGYVVDPVERRSKNTANIMGAYITDIARANLVNFSDYLGFDNLLYCDTDSWFARSPETHQIPPELLGEELGQWKLEKVCDEFYSIRPKQYKYHLKEKMTRAGDVIPVDEWVVRIKGVNIEGVVMQQFRLEFETGRPPESFRQRVLSELDLTDCLKYERLIGLKESWRKGEEAGTWITQEKQMRQR